MRRLVARYRGAAILTNAKTAIRAASIQHYDTLVASCRYPDIAASRNKMNPSFICKCWIQWLLHLCVFFRQLSIWNGLRIARRKPPGSQHAPSCLKGSIAAEGAFGIVILCKAKPAARALLYLLNIVRVLDKRPCWCFQTSLLSFTSGEIEATYLVGLLIDNYSSSGSIFTYGNIQSPVYGILHSTIWESDIRAYYIFGERIGWDDSLLI